MISFSSTVGTNDFAYELLYFENMGANTAHELDRNEQEITNDTTDVVWIYHANRIHWVIVHLQRRQWRIIYYDSLFHEETLATEKHSMEKWYGEAIIDIRRRRRT